MKSLLKKITFVLLFLAQIACSLPKGFVYLNQVDPSILQNMNYATTHNFIGRKVTGYEKPTCILTQATAEALKIVQANLRQQGLSLKVYDCYRPQMAVNDFMQWSRLPQDQTMKALYYPHVDKANVFKLGYVAEKSGHTRGSTVDITLVRLDTNQELNMGTRVDYLDPLAHPFAAGLSPTVMQNRLILRHAMLRVGFIPYENEWWHFTLKAEPYPMQYFNFAVR